MATLWHALSKKEVLGHFSVRESEGLSKEAVAAQRAVYGFNTLKKRSGASLPATFIKQFKSPLVLILFFAFFAALYLQEKVDALVIALALSVNVVIGFIQEYRAERAFRTLASSQKQNVMVMRNGTRAIIQSADVVPGDILLVEAGQVVSADAYILSASDVSVSEAHLTGESAPLEKKTGALRGETALYEQSNMLFSGSPVLTGSARAVAVKIGAETEIGTIAKSLSPYKTVETPIEKSVARLARFISIVVGAVVFMLLALGLLRGIPFSEVLILAIALAVSVVPEGLPAAVTAILAIGMERILKEKGLVRNLLAAETLGSTTIILTDKTGTLTQARMGIVDIVVGASRGYASDLLSNDQRFLLKSALRVSDVFIMNGTHEAFGKPIEQAVVSAAFESGVAEEEARDTRVRLDFLTFSSANRFAAALYENTPRTARLYINGAPELLLEQSESYFESGEEHAWSDARKKDAGHLIHELAGSGKRVIAVSYRDTTERVFARTHEPKKLLAGNVFVGLFALADPPREEVPAAIAEVRRAGVRVVMVTGDTPETAMQIALHAGIAHSGESFYRGSDIEGMSDKGLYEALMHVPVFARVLPHQKQRLVTVLQSHGEVVAMTGDGVNDAPALSAAQIGVAVGSGTEVAREASGLVLLDDSFSIIVSAIREGRRILDNIKKAITHLITASFHEVFIISFAVVTGLPLPVLPVQILWVNILEEGFLTFAFAFEPAEHGVMQRSPRSMRFQTALTKEVKQLIMIAGVITGVFSTGLYVWLLSRGTPIEELRTIMFVVLSLDSLLFAISLKNLHRPLWTIPLFNNRYLIFAVLLSACGIFLTLTLAPLRALLSLTVPNMFDLVVLAGVAVANIVTIEAAKKIAFSERAQSIA